MLAFNDFLLELTLTLQYHRTLNPKLWQGGQLNPTARKQMLDYAYRWADFAGIPRAKIVDVFMTGGNANFNYTPQSDIDIHVIVDKKAVKSEEYYKERKRAFIKAHPIKVMGYSVEPFAQDLQDHYPLEQGIFSLKHDNWVEKPVWKHHDFKNDPQLKRKIEFFMHQIDQMTKEKASKAEWDRLKTKLGNMRGAGLNRGGEFSIENLVFKDLRNRGYLDKFK